MKLIDKDALVAEIERIEHETNYETFTDEVLGKRCVCKSLLSFLDTFEMKEVDLEKSISDWLSEGLPNDEELIDYIKETANHFFELGLKAQKGK